MWAGGNARKAASDFRLARAKRQGRCRFSASGLPVGLGFGFGFGTYPGFSAGLSHLFAFTATHFVLGKVGKPLAPRFGPCGVPSLRYCYGALAAYGSLRSPTSRACTMRRVCCAHAPSQHRNEASLTSRSSVSAPWVFFHAHEHKTFGHRMSEHKS